MRIGIVGPTWPDSFAVNIIDSLGAMGHQPLSVGSTYSFGNPYTSAAAALIRGAVPALDERAQRRVLRAALDAECEIVIVLEQRLVPEIVRELRRGGIKVAMWFPDSLLNMGRQLMLLSPYDAVFVKDPYLVRRLGAVLDLPLFYLPEACNPRCHRPVSAPGTEPHLVIAGNMYPSRIRLLERLLAHGIPLRLYGAGFPRWVGKTPLREVHAGRCIFDEEKARIYRSAAGVLNNLHPAEIEGVNARLFEAAGCGAAVLTEFRPALPDLFAIGDEVLAFRDFDELLAQATRLLADPALTAKVGDAAAARAHESHCYENRLAVILEKLSRAPAAGSTLARGRR
jgi:spore maturation protein CgeB